MLGGYSTLDSGSFVAHPEVSAPGKVDGSHRTREGRGGMQAIALGRKDLVLPQQSRQSHGASTSQPIGLYSAKHNIMG